MSFTQALYYPKIDIPSSSWLKSNILFWDNIKTIVPEEIKNPYQSYDTNYLADSGILSPYILNRRSELMDNFGEEIINLVSSDAGKSFLQNGNFKESNHGIYAGKIPVSLEQVTIQYGSTDKVKKDIVYKIENQLKDRGYIKIDSGFAELYMSILANKICQKEKMVLLTDNTLASDVSQESKFSSSTINSTSPSSNNVTTGILANLILEGIKFSEDTDIKKIIKFKNDHKDELGLFRVKLNKLVSEIPDVGSEDNLKQHMNDIYVNEFSPAYNNFKNALKSYRIKWISENFMKIALFKGSTSSLLPLFANSSLQQGILIGAGLTLAGSIVSYRKDKEEILRNNPYSYLYSLENKYG